MAGIVRQFVLMPRSCGTAPNPGFDVADGSDHDMAMWGWSTPIQLVADVRPFVMRHSQFNGL